jgi:CHASE3 domain sensor protein/putative methionine-R-sulfoxide reductase with GAF domain
MLSKSNNNVRIGFGLSILILIVSSSISYLCIRSLMESAFWVNHTIEVKNNLSDLLSSVKDAETGQRGFLITQEDAFLQPFNGANDIAINKLDKVQQLTVDNPVQQRNVNILKQSIRDRLEKLQLMIDQKRKGLPVNFEEMRLGKVYMDSVRVQTERMMAEENRLLAIRTQKQKEFTMITPIVIMLAAFLAIIISIVFYRRAVKDMAERVKLQLELQKKDKETVERINAIQKIASRISEGDYTIRMEDGEEDTLGELAVSLNKMADSLSYSFNKLSENEWLQRGVATLNDKMVGEKDLGILTQQMVEFITQFTGSHVGALYLLDKQTLVLQGGYALMDSTNKEIPLGQGIVGQAMLSGKEILIEEVDPDYVTISHATGSIRPKTVIAFPVFFENEPIGVLELASMHIFTPKEKVFLSTVVTNIGNAVQAAVNHKKLQELLEETQAQSEELQVQHSELENMNAELEAHTQKLQTSEEELRVQQ